MNSRKSLVKKPAPVPRYPLKKSLTSLPTKSEETKNPQLTRSSTLKPFPNVHPSLITINSQLGSGQSSSVFSCTVGSKSYALKIVSKDYKKYAKTEAEILKTLSDNSIIKCFKKFERPESTWLVLELVQGVDLFTYKKNKRLSVEFVRQLAKQLIRVLEKVHKAGVVYRDLKPENVMIENDGSIKVIDFGLAKVIGDEKTNTICGSAQYMAPEVLNGEFYDYSIDFWSLGAVLFECFVGKPPFDGGNLKEIRENVINGEAEFGKIYDIWARDFIRKLLCKNPEERLGQRNSKTIQIWSHRFLLDPEGKDQ